MIATSEPVMAQDNSAENDSTTFRKRRGTLLVVDDEDGPRQSLRVIFKDEYNLLMAEDGPTAIELAKQHPIDVAVLDIRMAGMSGIEVLERLKYVNPNIEAIMMTAFETTDTIRRALSAGKIVIAAGFHKHFVQVRRTWRIHARVKLRVR